MIDNGLEPDPEPAGEVCAQGSVGRCSRRTILVAGLGMVGSGLVAACAAGKHAGLVGTPVGSGSGSSAGGPGSTRVTASGSSASGSSASGSSASGSSTSGPSASRTAASTPAGHHATTPPAPRTVPAPTHPATKSAPPSPTIAPSTARTGTVLTALSAVPVGGSLVVSGPRGPVAIGRPSANVVLAHTAICTHQGCTVGAAGAQLACPCHGSVFDAFTGAVVHDPARSPLAAVSVRIEGTDIVTSSG